MPSLHELRDRLRHAVVTGKSGLRYQVHELIGEGGQGWVFKAAQEDAGAPFVVIKVLRPDLARSEAFARFEREATVLRALSSSQFPHPNIVQFHEHGRASLKLSDGPIEVPYLVLEYVDGPPLSRVLAAHGGFGLPVARARRILRQVVRALGDIHARNLVHRDLKPSNILLTQREANEVAKVTDFGIVKIVDASVHQTVALAGASAGYAPPEQYEAGNRRVGPATDVFAFGAILFEVLSGCEAFPLEPGDTALNVVGRMLGGDRPALSRVSATIPRELRDRPDLTAALDREIARATDNDPGGRHASIDELWAAVEPLFRAVLGTSTSFAKVSEPPPGSGPTPPEGAPSGPPRDPSTPPPRPAATAPKPAAQSTLAQSPALSAPRSAAAPPSSSSSHSASSARLVGKPMTGERLRGAAFSEDGRSLVAVGAYGLYRFANGVWSALRAPRGVDGATLRGVVRTVSGDWLLHGDGCAVRLAADGSSARVTVADGDTVWLGGIADGTGVVLVGERRSKTVGVVAVAPLGDRATVREIEGTTRLHGVARLDAGVLLVCGTQGALHVIDGAETLEVPWGRTGHLFAAAPARDGGAHVVGSGGHALSVSPPHPSLRGVAPPATLEAVQTTRDLTDVIVDGAGTAWAAGAQGRILVRQAGTWSRVPVDVTGESFVALATTSFHGRAREIVAVAEDGSVVVVTLA